MTSNKPDRYTHQTNMGLNYFDNKKIDSLTGLDKSQWDSIILKELIDNALDAIDGEDAKEINIEFKEEKDKSAQSLGIYDSGQGIPEEVLEAIHANFDSHTSNKSHYRTPARGHMGNALKTIIGICYLSKYDLFFFTGGKKISYKLDEQKLLSSSIVRFVKEMHETPAEKKSGALIVGNLKGSFSSLIIKDKVLLYHLCNPDVTFAFNDKKYKAVRKSISRNRTYIAWYDWATFNKLLQATVHRRVQTEGNKRIAIKQFCGQFHGAQKAVPKINLKYRYLDEEFAKDHHEVKALYDQLIELLKPPRDQILTQYLTGKAELSQMFGEISECKYKAVFGHYDSDGATIPFAIEGFLANKKISQSFSWPYKMIWAFNNSVPYLTYPFEFNDNSSYQFFSYEFRDQSAILQLCKAIKDHYGQPLKSEDGSIEWLNEFLRSPYFHDGLIMEHKNKTASIKKIKELAKAIEEDREDPEWSEDEPEKIAQLNRQIFETIYPDLCPKTCIEIAGKKFNSNTSILHILYSTGLDDLEDDNTLYISYISPHNIFLDQGKTKLEADKFKKELMGVIDYLTKDYLKKNRFERKTERRAKKGPYIKDLMQKHLMEAYNHASSNGTYLVTARQVFYPLRDMISDLYSIDLKDSSYKSFTQDRITEFFEKFPELEGKIFFEMRGIFRDPFGLEVLLGTQDVTSYIKRTYSNRIRLLGSSEVSIQLDLHPAFLYNRVLFIEKSGFRDILEKSGLVKRLGIGIMSTQGFGTRAGKKLIHFFCSNGIEVYVLHDCDIPGYNIMRILQQGSKTFQEPLDVIEVGLTVKQITNMGKEEKYAEIVGYSQSYSKLIHETLRLTEEEKGFFVPKKEETQAKKEKEKASKSNEKKEYYRRVELNALTSHELITLIEENIPVKRIEPSKEELEGFLTAIEGGSGKQEIIKNALFEVYGNKLNVDINKDEIVQLIAGRLACGQEHWMAVAKESIKEYTRVLTSRLIEDLKEDGALKKNNEINPQKDKPKF